MNGFSFATNALRTRIGSDARVEDTIASVAEARADVVILVQAAVDHARVDLNVGMFMAKFINALRCSHDAEHLDAGNTSFFNCLDCHAGGPSGGQHRIEDEGDINRARRRQLAVIVNRFGGRFVSVKSQVPDFGSRNQIQHRLDHPNTSSQDGNQSNTDV